MNIDWEDAPHWARFAAMDGDGTWNWYQSKPKWDNGCNEWITRDRYEAAIPKEADISLQERP